MENQNSIKGQSGGRCLTVGDGRIGMIVVERVQKNLTPLYSQFEKVKEKVRN